MRTLIPTLLVVLASTALAEEKPAFVPARDAGAPAAPSLPERLSELEKKVLGGCSVTRGLAPKTEGRFKLAVMLVELADSPRPQFGPKEFGDALFAPQYRVGPSGEPVHGSVREYWAEQSKGKLELGGKVFDWVKIAAKRSEVGEKPSSSLLARHAILDASIDALLAREGSKALDEFDALAFIVSGGYAQKWRAILWPHASQLFHRGKAWRYYLTGSGTHRMEPIGVQAHELGHVLGLPDEYGLVPSSGSGIYCCMAIGNEGGLDAWVPLEAPKVEPLEAAKAYAKTKIDEARAELRKRFKLPAAFAELGDFAHPLGEAPSNDETGEDALFCRAPHLFQALPGVPANGAKPLHICAPCKVALGWVKPRVLRAGIDRVVFSAIEEHPDDVLALPSSNGAQVLLEYRGRSGFDAGLPRTGLVAWRTGDPTSVLRIFAPGANGELLPAHGIATVDAAHRGDSVMFPWRNRDLVVPGRDRPVRITGMREEAGRLYVEIKK